MIACNNSVTQNLNAEFALFIAYGNQVLFDHLLGLTTWASQPMIERYIERKYVVNPSSKLNVNFF